ncbi:MAG: hypothetical protein AMJ54_02060 [Deltaproteobacteria bacterium SG8_13]|nr:MAG: hypothetical protein AMJ54_02060 [Deltaproteobacteria bacterium SG8_13]
MGEIKSTLDLVLEKTRHLTLSEEEKHQQKHKDARNRLAGLLQRYQDGKLDVRKMGEELDRLVQADSGPDESMVRDEIMGRIELGSENGQWLALLQTRYRCDISAVQSVEEDFRHTAEAAAERRKEQIKTQFEQVRRISGSAVVPNLNADRSWIAEQQSMMADFSRRLEAELGEMKKVPT